MTKSRYKMSEELTIREKEFIELRFDKELGMEEIAEKMRVKKRTVRFFSTSSFRKLGLRCMCNSDLIGVTKSLIRKGVVKL